VQVDGSVPLKEVHATRGKYLRAEPVAALYEQGKVKHVGCFPLLEDEMCDFGIKSCRRARRVPRMRSP
jgi:phage terminase large subunit-like protein